MSVEHREDSVIRRICSDIVINPVLTASEVSSRYNVSYEAGNRALKTLAEGTMLRTRNIKGSNKGAPTVIYIAQEIIDCI